MRGETDEELAKRTPAQGTGDAEAQASRAGLLAENTTVAKISQLARLKFPALPI